jgi:amino acid transporter
MAAIDPSAADTDTLTYEHSGMPKTGWWWSAFVIGLACPILVTGIGPTMAVGLGASSIPIIILITLTGWLVCMFLSELSAMMPERTGGMASYVYPAFRDRWPRFGKHAGAVSAWGYWMGWFPVAPLNMILASAYIAHLFHLSESGFSPLGTPITYWTLAISIVGILLLFIPSYRGLKFGTGFATTLAVLSIIPLTYTAIAWVFNPSSADFSQLTSFGHSTGGGFFSPAYGHGWFTIYIAFSFLLTWNVIAMEAAACYIGECKEPARDAKIALNLEAGYGLYVFTLIPIAFVLVIGNHALANPALTDPKTIFVEMTSKVFGVSAASTVLTWLVAWMLIIALVLSALNAITGTSRSLAQMSIDGNFPRFFGKLNSHGVPAYGMIFTVTAAIIVTFMGGAVQIYTFSNVGYLIPFFTVLFAYWWLRRTRPNLARPVRLPGFMAYVALAVLALYLFIYIYGGPTYANCACNAAGKKTLIYYFLGFGALAMYVPLYLWRHRVEDKRVAAQADASASPAATATLTPDEVSLK